MQLSYNWLKEFTGETTANVQEAAALLGKHAFEIEGVEEGDADSVIEVDILPNRASDCLCHRGIARELATITGKPLMSDPLAETPNLKTTEDITVDIADATACPRFTASLITGVKIKESPQWLQERLKAIGQRPINNIVDATNYVMFAIGQPLHAYDADLFPQVDGSWQFGVRYAEANEKVSLIAEGGKDEERIVELQGTELLIVDNSSNTPIGLAGVKGGRFAGVHLGTTKIIIEAAHFHPTVTRKTARRLGIVIDASKRFENEPSRELPSYAQSQIISLILDIAGGEYVGTVDEYLDAQIVPEVPVSVSRVNAHLGIQLSAEDMITFLERAGCKVRLDGEVIHAQGPFERTDLNIQEDYIEEIGRLNGYDKIVSVQPEKRTLPEFNQRHYYSEIVREVLIENGFSEVITSSFRKKDAVQLRNALASDKSFLRSNLTKNISVVLDKNASFADLLGAHDTRVFEIGNVFSVGGENGVTEHVALALGVRLKQNGYTGKEDKVLQQVIEKIDEALGVKADWKIEKGIAETNFTKVFESLPETAKYNSIEIAEEITYRPFSLYPHMSRDIALWVDEGTDAESVMEVLNTAAGDLRVRTDVFDEFAKDGKVSLAFRLIFQSKEKTLTDNEVNKIMDSVNSAAAGKGWEVR